MPKLSRREQLDVTRDIHQYYMAYVDRLVIALEKANKVIQVADQITNVLDKQTSPSHRTNNRMQ